MSKQRTDANGRTFVVVVQVAPHDVVSTHATIFGSAGAGIEVASNASDDMQPLQGLAGIIVATMVKAAEPRLAIVNHRGTEGLEMLQAYEGRLRRLRNKGRKIPPIKLPFVPVNKRRMAAASGRLAQLIAQPGRSPSIPVARSTAPPQLVGPIRPARRPIVTLPAAIVPTPVLIGPIRPAVRPVNANRG